MLPVKIQYASTYSKIGHTFNWSFLFATKLLSYVIGKCY